jgi:hypothetical protein
VRVPINAPLNQTPTTGLVALAVTPTDLPAQWEGGFGFEPESCDPAALVTLSWCEQADEKDVPGRPSFVVYDPALLIGGDACSTLGPRDGRLERARRQLQSTTSEGVERLFWTGEAAGDGPDVVRQSLTDGTAVTVGDPGGQGPADTVSLLDQALAGCLHGVAGMVHVPPVLLPVWAAADVIWRSGDRWLTPGGHTVVAGAGYTGGAPRPVIDPDPFEVGPLPAPPDLLDLGDVHVYATGPVGVILSDIVTFGDATSRIDRAINHETVLVERVAAAYHSGCCKFHAVATRTDA